MKKFSSLLILTATLLYSGLTLAEMTQFSNEAFKKAQSEGQSIIVDFHASWCPTCKKQEPLINEILKSPGYEKVIGFKADYDKEKELKKSLGVTKQSTLVVFKGSKEVSRKTGITDKNDIKALIDTGL